MVLTGFGNEHASEAEPGALPRGQNSPQRPAHGLFAEQLSGTAFTVPRDDNRRSWLYRRRPSVRHLSGFRPVAEPSRWRTAPIDDRVDVLGVQRWDPLPLPRDEVDFLSGLATIAANGDARVQCGVGVHLFAATASMGRDHLVDADGELVLVVQQGRIDVPTEFGVLAAGPGELVVVPRGVCFRVDVVDGPVRGWVAENHGQPLRLPELGPIGANGLADARDFRYPEAAPEDDEPSRVFFRTAGRLWVTEVDHSPLDVVAWHGDHAPYVYDLRAFNTLGSISYDHPDPSIFTVLTSPSDTPGTANLDVVVFGDRWLVAEHTFRPPWFHRNVMSEIMGLVEGVYDAKPQGFAPGGTSLHNQLLPHGPSAEAHRNASSADLVPEKLSGTLAFMFESRYPFALTSWAVDHPARQPDYRATWDGLEPPATSA